MSEQSTPRPDQGATPRDDSAAPANQTPCKRCGKTDKMSPPRPVSEKQIQSILSDEADAEDLAYWRGARRAWCSRCEVTTTTFGEIGSDRPDASAAPATATQRTGLLTYSPDTGAATYVSDGTQVALGKHQTLFDAYAAAREDGHRPSRWMTRLGGVTLRLDHADHWDRMFEAKRRGSRS